MVLKNKTKMYSEKYDRKCDDKKERNDKLKISKIYRN